MVHNPLKEVTKILNEVRQYLDKDGIIFFDYWRPNPEDGIKSVKDFVVRKEVMEKLLSDLNFYYEDIKEFRNYQSDKHITPFHRMMKISEK
jgi:hypothetical protein